MLQYRLPSDVYLQIICTYSHIYDLCVFKWYIQTYYIMQMY